MGEVIEFPRKINVELEDDMPAQAKLELAIIFLWDHFGGNSLRSSLTNDQYNLALLQFSDCCFQAMENDHIIVTEDNDLGINTEVADTMKGVIDDLAEREFGDNDN